MEDIVMVIKGVCYCVLSILFLNYFYPIAFVNFKFIGAFWLDGTLLLLNFRIFGCLLHSKLLQNTRNPVVVLLAGTGNKAISFAKEILTKPELGYKLKGFIDTKWDSEMPRNELPDIISDFDSLSTYLRENVIDEIIIYLPVKTFYEQISKIIAAAEEQGIVVRYSAEFFNQKLARVTVEQIGKEQHLTLYTGSMFSGTMVLKELMDFFAALILILLLSPILIIAAIAIKLTSPGPVFFIQNRLGKNKRLFNLIKFRTMVINAEEMLKDIEHLNDRKGEATFKIKNDPRVTPIGRILRKTSIDELPQLLNVLAGDISLVGPRPLPVRDYRGFDKDWQRRRFSVKPGITCIWQVSGRDNISFEDWMKMDMYYIDNWSLRLDFKLLLKTIPVAIFGSGAS